MIELTKLNGKTFILNADLIETVEETPDTVIKLINDRKVIVKEKKDEVINLVIQYKRKIYCYNDSP